MPSANQLCLPLDVQAHCRPSAWRAERMRLAGERVCMCVRVIADRHLLSVNSGLRAQAGAQHLILVSWPHQVAPIKGAVRHSSPANGVCVCVCV